MFPEATLIIGLSVASFVVNLPLGWLRMGKAQMSAAWFFYVHASIPFIVLARYLFGIQNLWLSIPVNIGAAVLGQLLGGNLRVRARGKAR